MKIEISNNYSDGHESTRHIVFDGPAFEEPRVADVEVDPVANEGLGDYEGSFWEENVEPFTGDGHGDGSHGKLGFCHVATIVEADNPELVGKNYEWAGI